MEIVLQQESNTQTSRLTFLNDLRKNGQFCDWSIRCQDDQVKMVHKIVLMAGCRYFQDMLAGNVMKECSLNEITMSDMSGDDLEFILDFIYVGTVTVRAKTQEHLIEKFKKLLHHARYLKIDDLETYSINYLKQVTTVHNCLDMWRFAMSNAVIPLTKVAQDLMYSESEKFTQTYCADLTLNEVQFLVSNYHINYDQNKIFHFILDWIKFHEKDEDIASLSVEVMSLVKFNLLSHEFLISKVLPNPIIKGDHNLLKVVADEIYTQWNVITKKTAKQTQLHSVKKVMKPKGTYM